MTASQHLALEFADTARRYCSLIDAHSAHSAEDLLRQLGTLLPELLYRGASLHMDDREADLPPVDPNRHAAWETLSDSLNAHLGDFDLYWEVFDPVNRDEDDPISATLSDGLADIYLDLVSGHAFAETPDTHISVSTVANWRFQYEAHWGQHAASALRAIHSWLFAHELSTDA